MRKFLVIFLICLPFVALAGGDFSDGYKRGFEEGYKYVMGQIVLPPLAPLPPLPRLGEDSFFGGYNVDFIDGVKSAGGRFPR
jgi:hypothetical protein